MWITRYFRRTVDLDGGVRAVERHGPRVLNVGGGDKSIQMPAHYGGWNCLLLDIDQRRKPDIVCDARRLETLCRAEFDAVYCSHNLEHYFYHEVRGVLRGFMHVLKPNGFAEIVVPDVQWVMRHVVRGDLDIGDKLYDSPVGPITVRDVIYGWTREIETSGQGFYAHKTGFTPKSLELALIDAGFLNTYIMPPIHLFEARAFAFKEKPTPQQVDILRIPC